MTSQAARPSGAEPECVEPDAALALRLIAAECPQLSGQRIAAVSSSGTENALFRLGREFVIRFPRTPGAIAAVDKEHAWLPKLAGSLNLAVPAPVHRGLPQTGYPRPWSVFRWLPGRDAWREAPADLSQAASDLAAFVNALRAQPCAGGPIPSEHNAWRGVPLATLDNRVRRGIEACGDLIRRRDVTALWERALAEPASAQSTWLHGDLQPGNLLVQQGRVTAVIDFGLLGVGDPAVDLLPAWNLLDARARRVYRDALEANEPAWIRSQGWAVFQAVMALPFYLGTNRVMVRLAQRQLGEVLRAAD